MSYLRHMSCVALLAFTLAPAGGPRSARPAAAAAAPRPASPPAAAAAIGAQPAASAMPEVRLRKLHLVRPDLIPYPIEFDVYC